MEFDDVTILGRVQESASGEYTPAEVSGQVSDFAHFSYNTFQLTTCESDIKFTAGRMTVTLRSREC